MKYPRWNDFIGKYPEKPQEAFEALCRLLFRTRFGIVDSLSYFYNNAGNETVPINVGNDLIGFQSKFFSGNTIDDSQANQIIHSIKTIHTYYPKQTKIIVYTNSTFGNPKPGKQQTLNQEKIEDTAQSYALSIEWVFGENILDIVSKTPLAYSLFFDPNSHLNHLAASVNKMNKLNFENICSTIEYKGKEIELDRSKEVANVKEIIAKGNNVLIYGESGSGKSTIVKRYWEETAHDITQVIYFTRGAQFDTKSVNELFLMEESYSYVDFRDFYNGFSKKILIIDSAEKLTEIGNLTILQMVLDGLGEKGWQFVFTCKSNSYNKLRSILRDIGTSTDDLKIDTIQEEDLRDIANLNNISLPQSEKVLHQIQIPFYLARFCELGDTHVATLEAFRETIWMQKVRGEIQGGIQKKRETCLLQIVKEQQISNNFFVTPDNIDYDAAYSLIQEDVLIEQPHRGYAVKHDIYVDWALEYIVEQDCNTDVACIKLLQSVPKSITYINAFRRWLEGVIDTQDSRITAIVKSFANGTIQKCWEHSIMTAIGNSYIYSKTFFTQYDTILKANNYALFDLFVDVLDVSCKTVSQYYKYKGERYPIYKPVGRGWEEAVLFVYANKDDYYMSHLGTVQKLLNSYSKLGNKGEAMNQAAQLSLIIFDVIAENRKQNQYFLFQKEKTWCELVCTYAFWIKDELNERFQQVILNHWVHHTDPYSELIDYILKDSIYNFSKSMLYMSCMDSVISLMHLLWREQPNGKHWHQHHSFERNYVFGLNEDFGMDMAYFPASPFQTPIGVMLDLNSKNNKVLDFIIDFMNECIRFYNQRDKLEKHTIITMHLPNSTSNELIASQSLWNLYRGTAYNSMPHLLESMHMALESWLLNLTEEKQKPDWMYIKGLLFKILTRSQSASLYAIVASVAVAHPDELFDIIMLLCQDIRLIDFDLHRFSNEISVHAHSIAFQHHKSWWKEREHSNNLPHRQDHLETILLKCQYAYENSQDEKLAKRLEIAYQVVDSLKKQVAQIGYENPIYKYILARVDYSTYNKQNITLKNGIEAVQLTPNFTLEMETERKKLAEFSNRLDTLNLRLWADKKFKGKEQELKGNRYLENHQGVLETIRSIEKQLKNQTGNQLLLLGDQYVPYMASAVLLMFECENLNDIEKNECWERVKYALNSLKAMASDTMSELNICIAAIPALIDIFPERQSDFIYIIAEYVKVNREFINQRICDMMSDSIHNGQLWSKYPEMMNTILDMIQKEVSGGDWETMNLETADALLCLLTFEPPEDKRYLGKICIEKLSDNWQISMRYNFNIDKYYIARNVSKYILYAPSSEITLLIRPYISMLDWNSSREPLITQFVVGAPQYHKYENFWIVWNALYKSVIENADRSYQDTLLNEYLLNPLFFSQDYDDWFNLKEKDLAFFERVANDIGRYPIVLYAFTHVFATIGKVYSKQAIALFGDIINNYNPNINETKDYVVYYLEKITKKVFSNNKQELRSDLLLRTKFIVVLKFMQKNGSSVADEMLKNL